MTLYTKFQTYISIQMETGNSHINEGVIEVLPGLWVGEIGFFYDDTFLTEKQIQMVITCAERPPKPNKTTQPLTFHVPITHSMDFSRLLDQSCQLIQQHINQKNILLCGSSASLIISVYLMKVGQMDYQSVSQALKSKRLDIDSHIPFLRQIQKI